MRRLGHNTARALIIMFVASSSEPLTSLSKIMPLGGGGGGKSGPTQEVDLYEEKLRFYIL